MRLHQLIKKIKLIFGPLLIVGYSLDLCYLRISKVI